MNYTFEKTNKLKLIKRLFKNSGIDFIESEFNDDKVNTIIIKDEKSIVCGCVVYKYIDKTINIEHTCVDKEFSGKGIGKLLVDYVISSTSQFNYKYTATCKYAKKVLSEK